jgi:hypothetical protein
VQGSLTFLKRMLFMIICVIAVLVQSYQKGFTILRYFTFVILLLILFLSCFENYSVDFDWFSIVPAPTVGTQLSVYPMLSFWLNVY